MSTDLTPSPPFKTVSSHRDNDHNPCHNDKNLIQSRTDNYKPMPWLTASYYLSPPPLPELMSKTGTVEFQYNGKAYRTAYEVWGDLHGGKTPLVVLHGGPGMSHHYMLPHVTIYEKAGIPIVIYDEIGNGNSSLGLDEPNEFWTVKVFMAELENLLQQLDIQSNFNLLGHSWGGILASSYAIRAPPGLKKLIIVDSPTDVKLFQKGTHDLLRKNFPPEFADRLKELYKSGQGDSNEYKLAALQFYKKHMCRLDPWPEELVESMKASQANPHVRKIMMGVSTIHITGTLRNWSNINDIHKITASMLLISSPNDEVQEEAIMPYFLNAQKIKWVEIPSTTHMPMFEDPERYFAVILSFLGDGQ